MEFAKMIFTEFTAINAKVRWLSVPEIPYIWYKVHSQMK